MTVPPALAPTRLVGRDSVLGAIDGLVTRLENGACELAVVTGPVGTGRSAVLEWAVTRARAAGVAVGVARCSPRESRIPYGTVTQLMATLCPPSRFGALAGALGPGTRPTAAVARMCDTLLAEWTGRPVLLAVDDVHLADTESLRWLVRLGGHAHDGPVLALATSPLPVRQAFAAAGTHDPARPCPVHTLRLEPLTADEAHTLLERYAGRPLERSVLAATAVAGGSPAVLRAVADRMAELDRPLGTDALPHLVATARAAWSERALTTAHGLSEDTVGLLRVIAAVGHLLDSGQIAAVAGLDATPFDDAVETLRACGLLAEAGTPRLAHPWFADDVLAGMTRAERDTLHLRAAALHGGSSDRIGTVADMLGAVTGLVRPWSTTDSAPTTRPRPADVTTAALRHALREPVTEPERARLLLRLAGVEAVTAPQASDGRLRQVMLRHATQETWSAVLHAADLLLSRGDAETTRWVIADVHQRALTAIPDAQLRPLRALGRLARDETGGPPLVAPPPAHTDHPGHPAQAAVLAWTLAARADDRVRVLDLARTTLAEPADVPLMCRIAASRALLCADDVTGGLDRLDAVITDAGAAGARAVAAQALLTRAEAAVRLGRPEDGLRDLAAATRELPPASWHTLLRPRLTAAEVLALVRCGRVDEARRVAERSRTRTGGHSVTSGFLLYARAELALIDGDAAGALLLLEECGRLLRSKRWHNPMLIPWRGTAAVAHHHLGAPDAAAELLAEEHRVVERWGTADAFTGLRTRTHDTLARYGVDLPGVTSRSAPAATPADPEDRELSDAERAVTDLVLAGHGNREIATRLGLSTRTVELRLTKLYRRLGVKGRSALVTHLLAGQEDG